MDQKATEDESGGVPVFDELGLQLVELSHNGPVSYTHLRAHET